MAVDRIVYRFPEMTTTAGTVENLASQYESAANELADNLISSLASWEGEAKDAFVLYIDNTIRPQLYVEIPKLIRIIHAQIEGSRNNMRTTDGQLAEHISQAAG